VHNSGAHPRINSSAASPWIEAWIARLAGETPPPRRALDVAMGGGRHALPLARAGFSTFGVDRAFAAVQPAVAAAAALGLRVHGWCADLTTTALPPAHFQLIVVTRYLDRNYFDALADVLSHGGVLLYETFTEAQRAHGWGPTSPEHLLVPGGELQRLAARLTPLFYEEVDGTEAVARLAARKD